MTNPFVNEAKDYVRSIDPINQAIDQYAVFIQRMRNVSFEQAREFAFNALKNKVFPKVKDPKVEYLERNEFGDRERKTTTLKAYIYDSLQKEELIAPTLTTYMNPKKKQSILVKYIDKNIAKRKVAKKKMFLAKAIGDEEVAAYQNNMQNNMKTKNNSLSGLQVSPSTPLTNKTAHSTLTSNCRTTSGYGNANNEKFLSGNRHYWAYDIVINNIVSIISNVDYALIESVLHKYNIHIPTVQDVIECIDYSRKMYWNSKKGSQQILDLVTKLKPLERAAFVYVGDLYHLKKHNDALTRDILTGISTKKTTFDGDSLEFVNSCPENYTNLARSICSDEMKGKEKDYSVIKGTQDLTTLAGTLECITTTLNKYSDLISAFWVTKCVPASVAYFPDSVRRSALTSDTDSTIFTVQDWSAWYYNKPFVKPGSPVAYAAVFLAAATITHVLAMMSANFGIETARIHQVSMKNEFFFDVFVPTNVSKHYFARILVQEGIVFPVPEYEIKGVHLKNSNAPEAINKQAHDMLKRILNTVAEGKLIVIKDYLKEIGDLERNIYKSISEGSSEFLRSGVINDPDSYKNEPEQSPYIHHMGWEEVWSHKYGAAPAIPYDATRISVELDSRKKIKAWMDTLEDKALVSRLSGWLTKHQKDNISSLLIPKEIINNVGIPKELYVVMDIRKIVADITKTFYLIMETLGFYISNKKITRLISDMY